MFVFIFLKNQVPNMSLQNFMARKTFKLLQPRFRIPEFQTDKESCPFSLTPNKSLNSACSPLP